MKYLSFLLFFLPYFAISQHHELKMNFLEFHPKNLELNLAYEYIFPRNIGLQFHIGYEEKISVNKYSFPNKSTEAWYDLIVYEETFQRNQIKLLAMGKYYPTTTPTFLSPYLGGFLNSNILISQSTKITPDKNYLGNILLPLPKTQLNVGLVFGGKWLFWKESIVLETEAGVQMNTLRIIESTGYAAVNLGYRFR